MRKAALLLLLAASLAVACNRDHPTARASRIESPDQAIGGPTASARKGDFLLENDQIRVVIEQGGKSRLPLDVGGSIADIDLVRHEEEFRGGRGLDQLGQIAPLSNLYIAHAVKGDSVQLSGSEHGAEVTTKSEAGPILKLIDALGLLIARDFAGSSADYSRFNLYTEYELRPGERILRVTTTIGSDVPFCPPMPGDHCNASCDDILYDDDCSCPEIPARCSSGVRVVNADSLPDRPAPMGLSDVVLGDLPRPLGTGGCHTDVDCDASAGETCVDITTQLGGESRACRGPAKKDAGLFIGDMLLFGGHLAPFVRGTGFDTDTDLRRLFDSGADTLSTPLELDEVYAIGDRVSYGYASPSGKILVPIFGGPFSMGATHALACRHDQPACLKNTLVRAERWVSVGSGDAASAREPILRAREKELGTISGVVRYAHSGAPASGAQVFAVADPRALFCDEACVARCGDLSAMDDAGISKLSIEALFAQNKCRTPSAVYLQGTAGIETFARTDPGTDPIKDGVFTLALPPGKWVLVARADQYALSSPLPVEARAGGMVRTAFSLNELARIEYAIFDEKGAPVPGRMTVTSSERPQPVPLELGGERNADDAVAFAQTASGEGTLALPAGKYRLIFSRGPASTIDVQEISIEPGVSKKIRARVVRAVDRAGWSAADFHVHAGPSLDSGLALEDRVTSFLAEDMDFLSSSDHDTLTRYGSRIEEMGASTKLGSQVGVETTTQEIGHFISWPLKYEEWSEDQRVLGNGAPDWRELTPKEIFQALRARKVDGLPHVVEVPHPYTYFDFYHLDPVTLEPSGSIINLFNPLASPENFSGEFDAMEIANSKSFDLLRRPTIGDVRFYSSGLDGLLAKKRSGELDEAGYQRAVFDHSTETVRRMLHRTLEEENAALEGEGASLECRCGSDGDCGLGRVCNPMTMTCDVPPLAIAEGETPPDRGLCRSLRGLIDDWFNMLNRGVRRTGVSGSDVHGLTGFEAGVPRTLLYTGGVRPPNLSEREVAEAVLAGHAIVTNGPMIHFHVNEGGVGDTVTASGRVPVTIAVRVEQPGWFDVDRVEIYRNGELIHWITACAPAIARDEHAEPHAHPCIGSSIVAYEEELADQIEDDAWYVVIALGIDGRSLAPVYSSAVLPRLGTFELTQRIYDIIPALGPLRTPRFPSLYPTFPFAVTNPIWVDVGGDGWKPPRAAPSWCTPGKDASCSR